MISKKYYTLKEIADITHVSVFFLKKLIKSGDLKASRISKNYIVSEYDLARLIENKEVKQYEE